MPLFLLSLVLKISITISFNEPQAHFIVVHSELLPCSEANGSITEPRPLKDGSSFPGCCWGMRECGTVTVHAVAGKYDEIPPIM